MNFLAMTNIRTRTPSKISSFARCCASESIQLIRFCICCTNELFTEEVDMTNGAGNTGSKGCVLFLGHPHDDGHQLNHPTISVPLHGG